MAAGKKKKKPVANPARGFATTSIASKPRVDISPGVSKEIGIEPEQQTAPDSTATKAQDPSPPKELTPEEFEQELEESELQLLVDTQAAKVKRDAARQKVRLETDRRVLRGHADPLNTKKWLPPELMEEVLDLVMQEGLSQGNSSGIMEGINDMPEDELSMKLWTLQRCLVDSGFPEEQMPPLMQHMLDIAPKLTTISKDTVWGLEDALEWMARNCHKDELPNYDEQRRLKFKSRSGKTWYLV